VFEDEVREGFAVARLGAEDCAVEGEEEWGGGEECGQGAEGGGPDNVEGKGCRRRCWR
jgi:hypothetical protein